MPAKVHTLSSNDRKRLDSSNYAFRKQRKEPTGDAPHVRSAIASFDQVKGVSDEDRDNAFRRIQAAAKRLGFDIPDTHWQQLGHHAHP